MKGKKGKTYYVRVRGVNGSALSPWTKAKKIKIKRIPDIYFVEDYFEQHAQRIDDLLKQINDN